MQQVSVLLLFFSKEVFSQSCLTQTNEVRRPKLFSAKTREETIRVRLEENGDAWCWKAASFIRNHLLLGGDFYSLVVLTPLDYRFRPDEIFRRIKVTTFAQLVSAAGNV